jgi:hypothetical protein
MVSDDKDAGYAGACHRAAQCADPLGSRPPAMAHQRHCERERSNPSCRLRRRGLLPPPLVELRRTRWSLALLAMTGGNPDSNIKQREDTRPPSRGAGSARGLRSLPPSKKQEGAGKAGCALHPRSRVQICTKENAHEHTGEAEAIRPSLRNGFNGLCRALPGDRAFLPPSPARSFASRELDASVGASGPHVFAVRVDSVRHLPPSRPPRPTARSWTIASAPLIG